MLLSDGDLGNPAGKSIEIVEVFGHNVSHDVDVETAVGVDGDVAKSNRRGQRVGEFGINDFSGAEYDKGIGQPFSAIRWLARSMQVSTLRCSYNV